MSKSSLGAWSPWTFELSGEAQRIFKKVTERLLGVSYRGLAVASQLVDGTNFAVLSEATEATEAGLTKLVLMPPSPFGKQKEHLMQAKRINRAMFGATLALTAWTLTAAFGCGSGPQSTPQPQSAKSQEATGKDIVKEKPSATLILQRLKRQGKDPGAWFKKAHDPKFEAKLQAIHDSLVDELIKARKSDLAAAEATLPWSSIGLDYEDRALEITIESAQFDQSKLRGYFSYLRGIVGEEVNLTLSPMDRPVQEKCDRKESCNPIEGGVEFESEVLENKCTVGYRAKYNGKSGFVAAGHCSNEVGDKIRQPFAGVQVGKVNAYTNSKDTHCDCLFVELTDNNWSMSDRIFALDAPTEAADPTLGQAVSMSGKNSYVQNDTVTDTWHTAIFQSGHVVHHLAVATYNSKSGDSGAPVVAASTLVGIHEGRGALGAYFTKQSKFTRHMKGLEWDF